MIVRGFELNFIKMIKYLMTSECDITAFCLYSSWLWHHSSLRHPGGAAEADPDDIAEPSRAEPDRTPSEHHYQVPPASGHRPQQRPPVSNICFTGRRVGGDDHKPTSHSRSASSSFQFLLRPRSSPWKRARRRDHMTSMWKNKRHWLNSDPEGGEVKNVCVLVNILLLYSLRRLDPRARFTFWFCSTRPGSRGVCFLFFIISTRTWGENTEHLEPAVGPGRNRYFLRFSFRKKPHQNFNFVFTILTDGRPEVLECHRHYKPHAAFIFVTFSSSLTDEFVKVSVF